MVGCVKSQRVSMRTLFFVLWWQGTAAEDDRSKSVSSRSRRLDFRISGFGRQLWRQAFSRAKAEASISAIDDDGLCRAITCIQTQYS
jgi:hypothetical protein